MAEIRTQLLPRIAALLPQAREARERTTRPAERPPRPSGTVRRPSGPPERIDVIVIGVSTGGPTALAELIPSLPADLPVPIAIVQHMPPMFTKILAERLDHKSALRVAEAADGDRLRAGHVAIAPGDRHLSLASGTATTCTSTTDPTRTRAGRRSIRCSAASPPPMGRTRSGS